MNRHLHTVRTPHGHVTYTHHDVATLSDGTDQFLSDGYLVPAGGGLAVPLSIDELLGVLASCGTGVMVRLAGVPIGSGSPAVNSASHAAMDLDRTVRHLSVVAR